MFTKERSAETVIDSIGAATDPRLLGVSMLAETINHRALGEATEQTVLGPFHMVESGDLLAATRRHPNRPAHVHFIVTAPDHAPVTTHLFVDGTQYIDSDVVFGVKEGLIREFPTVDD